MASIGAVNLVGNPDAEVDASGWNASHAAVARSTAQAHGGLASFALTGDSTAAGANFMLLYRGGSNGVALLPGQTLDLTTYVRAGSTGRTCRFSVDWLDSTFNYLSTSTGPGTTDNSTGWSAVLATLMAPANARWASPGVAVEGAIANGEIHYLDDFLGTVWFGVVSGEAFGLVRVGPAGSLFPDGLQTAEAEGTPTVTSGFFTYPSAIASGEAFGTASVSVTPVSVSPGGIASGQTVGSAALVGTVAPPAIGSGEAFGSAAVGASSLAPTGIASAGAVGAAQVNESVAPPAIASAEALGAVQVGRGFIYPIGLAAGAVGNPTVSANSSVSVRSMVSTRDPYGGIDPAGLLARTDLIYGSEIGAWRTDGKPVVDPATTLPDLVRSARVPLVRFAIYDVFTDLTDPLGNPGTQSRADFDAAINGIRSVLGAEVIIKLLPITSDVIGTKAGTLYCPPLNNLTLNLNYYKAVVAQAGSRVRVYESTNEMEYDCHAAWGYGSGGSLGISTVLGNHFAQNMPALKKYARGLGWEILTVGYMGISGGFGWGDSVANPFTRQASEFLTATHDAYVANGNDPDYIPDAVSIHAYPYSGDFGYTAPLSDIIAYFHNWQNAVRGLIGSIWGAAGANIKLAISEWNAGDSTWTGFSDSRVLDFYNAWLDMLRRDGYWFACQFALGSNTTQPYDTVKTDGTTSPQYVPFKRASTEGMGLVAANLGLLTVNPVGVAGAAGTGVPTVAVVLPARYCIRSAYGVWYAGTDLDGTVRWGPIQIAQGFSSTAAAGAVAQAIAGPQAPTVVHLPGVINEFAPSGFDDLLDAGLLVG